ncbi:MAG TPA: hypothetical protein VKE42_03725, partial [Candidatus Cybelea sp.]|nr:hypothetical protein [Candidatus Cybelea sp.]
EAIRRALELLPFVALLAAQGLDAMWSAETMRGRRLAFLAIWSVVIALILAYRQYVPQAQAFIRAATIPLGFVGLAALLRRNALNRSSVREIAIVALMMLGILEVLYFVAGDAVILLTLVLLGATSGAVFLRTTAPLDRAFLRRRAAIVLLAVLSSQFVYVYVGFPVIHRIGPLPASAQLAALRLVCAAAVFAAAITVVHAPRQLALSSASRRALVAASSVALVVIQIAYFGIDYFSDPRARYLHVAAVVVALVGLAVLLGGITVARVRLGQFATTALLVLAFLQFTGFYIDYFTGYRVRNSSAREGRVRLAYETLLADSRNAAVPAVHLSHPIEFPWLRRMYWEFYALKHHRTD